jgi:thymidylate synthase
MSSKSTGFIFKGNTTEVLKQTWDAIKKHGTAYKSQRGFVKSIKGATFVIEDPLNDSKNYPYWNKKADDWYQNNFVRKETNLPPEDISTATEIYPYKYTWRSRYFDLGYGHIKGVINLLKKLGVKQLNLKNKAELLNLLKNTYKFYHPELILAVLSWKGSKLINFYLKNQSLLEDELVSNRKDTLLSIIQELKQNPTSRRAIIPSFTYPHIDQSAGEAGGVPVYQNYQLYIEFDKKGRTMGLVSFHLHRAFDAYGGMQLDINHDKDWGQIASKELGIPLLRMVIYGNDVWVAEKKDTPKDLFKKTNIKSWLLAATDAYDPKSEDIEKRVWSNRYQKKIVFALKKH